MVSTGTFCQVLDDSYEPHGIKKGDLVFLFGDSMMPESEEDPYLYRRIFIAGKMNGEELDFVTQPLYIAGPRLRELPEEEQERLRKLNDKLFEGTVGEATN